MNAAPRAVAVALVLLLGLGALHGLPAQVIRVAVEVEVTLDPDMDAMLVDGEPHPLDVHVTVTNDGTRASTAYELYYEWRSPGGTRMPLRGSTQSSTDAGEPMLPGDDPQAHKLTWRPLEQQVGEGFVVVTVREGGTSVQHEPLEVFVEDHRFSLSADAETPLVLGPEETLHFPITVHNEGNVEEELTWTVTTSHARLDVDFLEPVQKVPADPPTSTAVLVVTYPFEGSTTDERDIVLTARATTPEGVTRFIDTAEIDILHDDLPPPPALVLDGPGATVFTQEETPVDVTFRLTNQGTQPDTYTFMRTATNGWSAEQVGGVSLAPGATHDLVVTVTPGPEAGRLSSLTLTATATSGASDDATADLAIGGVLPVVTGVAFTGDPVYVGDPVAVRVQYENVGNVVMEDASLAVRVLYDHGAFTQETVALEDLLPGRTRAVTVDLGTAKGAGQAVLTATLTAGDETVTAGSNDLVHSGLLSVTAPKPLAGAPGEQVRYHTPPHAFQVKNDGNAPEAVTVTAEGADLLGEATFTLQAGQTRTVAVTQNVPADVGDASTVPVRLTARLDEAPDRSRTTSVDTPVQDNTPPTVTWVESPQAMLPSDSRPLRVGVDDDTFVVRAWVDVVALDPDGGEPTDAGRVVLREAEDWIGLLRTGLPATLQVTPRAEDAFGNVGTGPARTVTVSHAPAPPPEPVTIDELAYENGTLTVRTNASSLTLLVDGEETLHDVADGELVLDLPLGTGKHLIEVVVDDAGGEVRKNTSVEIPAVPEEPGLLARLVPGPGLLAAVAALAAALVLRRRNRSGP